MTAATARTICRDLGMTLRSLDGEWRVNYRGGEEATAYYTDDLADVVETAAAMDHARNATQELAR